MNCWDVLCESESHIVGMVGERCGWEKVRERALEGLSLD